MKRSCLFLLGLALFVGGCVQTKGTQKSSPEAAVVSSPASKPKKKRREPVRVSYAAPSASKKPVATLRLRTTAYIGRKNAIGGKLSHGPVISAASDWSRFPLGTRFRIRQTGKTYVIDDYGSALIGTKTLDLAQPHQGAVNKWGARWVDVDILEWGSPRKSLEVLAPRKHVKYVRPMVNRLRAQSEGFPAEFHRIEAPEVKVRLPAAKPRREARPNAPMPVRPGH